MYNNRYSCPILMKLDFSRQISENTQISSLMKILHGSHWVYKDACHEIALVREFQC